MTSYSSILAAGASLPPSPDNALVTSGGTASRPLGEKLGETLDVRDFGAVGDGSTNNATALIALRTHLLQNPDDLHTIHFPRGEFRYNNNRWLHGLKRIKLVGQGNATILRCVFFAGGTHNFNTQPIRMPPPFHIEDGDSLTPNPFTTSNIDMGDLIDTAVIGQTVIQMKTIADAADYSVGDRVLLHGTVQQFGGWPANLRETVWNEVSAVDGIAGTVTLRWPLDRELRDDWNEDILSHATYGAARIVNLDDGRHYFEHLEMRDMKVELNTASSYSSIFQVAGRTVTLENVEARPYLSPRYCHYFKAHRSRFFPLIDNELDKGCGTLVFDECELRHGVNGNDSISGATGIDKLHVTRCYLQGRVDVSPRELFFDSNTVINDSSADFVIGRYAQAYVSNKWTITNNDFISTLNAAYIFDNLSGLKTVTVDSVGAANEIQASMADSGWESAQQHLDAGMLLATADGTKKGRMIRSYVSGANFVVETDIPATVEIGDVYYWAPYQRCIFEGNRFQGSGGRFIVRQFAQQNNETGELDVVRLHFGRDMKLNDALWAGWYDSNCQGTVTKIVVNVTKAYSGADTTSRLEMKRLGVERWIGRVNMAVAGRREITSAGIVGAQTGDDFNVSSQAAADTMNTWFHEFRLRPEREGDAYGFTGTDAQLPRGFLEIHIERP